jgi:aspartyl-tRNA(Asn)/glutamyl-tRNA(Gln) amidotransferase subunit A
MIGNYVLSSEQYEWSYLKAQKLRKKLKSDLDRVYETYDLIIGPTTPEVAWKIGSKWSDPLKVYLSDIYTIPANLIWSPAISVPIGMMSEQGELMPIGVQLMAAPWREDILFKVGHHIEQWYHTT